MKVSERWLKIAVLLILPLVLFLVIYCFWSSIVSGHLLFLVIRNIRVDQERTLQNPNPVKALVFVANGNQLAVVCSPNFETNERLDS
jgi:hypothetical protein